MPKSCSFLIRWAPPISLRAVMPHPRSAPSSAGRANWLTGCGQPAQQFAVMWGNFAWHVVRGDFKLCMDLAAEASQFVGALNNPA